MTLNEKISAWFEPKPKVITATSLNSFAGYWRCSTLPEWGWYPLNYDTDESANARLLEAMPNPDLSRGYGDMESSDASLDWRCDPFGDGELKYAQYHKDRKTAIVLAFCKFANIDIDGA